LQISFLSLSEFEQRTINHQPSEIKVAPDYYPVCQLKRENKRITKSLSGYDMAIITLTNSVNLETGIKVVSLATESDIPIPESIVYMVGYGQDVKDSDPAGRNGGILKKGSATVMACRHKTYGNPICVKPGPNSKQIAGPGDSGGPLLFSSQGPIIGVASSGVVLSSLADLCVEYSRKSMCTGSLVSTRAVLTASHCVCTSLPVSQVAFLTLRIGDPKGVHYKPSGVKVAPGYMPFCELARKGKPAKTAIGEADIAVIVLSQLVNLRVGIKVLSLPQPTDIPTPGTAVLIVGYGMDSNDRDSRRKVGGILKKEE
uniref:Peptidase S1 domain-containing protein n=1 Tax=Schistosoma curassoni TaxID=6186 RepID=A0A183K241_9TREM